MRGSAALATAVLSCVVVWVGPSPAGAQEAPDERAVRVQFEVGDFDGDAGDWGITVVHVTGDLEEGQEFTVELLDDDGIAIWSGTDTFTTPTTSITVVPFVAVGDVASTSISQAIPEVAGDVVTRPETEVLQQGSGGGGSGQLALSLVMAVILVAIVFRTPLPSATSQRWTK